MNKEFNANASITIDVPIGKVWDALVNPKTIKQYMFGTDVVSNWKIGSPIIWKGTWEGKEYEDKGIILKLEPNYVLQYTHFSPLAGLPDTPENYHTVALELTSEGMHTFLSLSQDNNLTDEGRKHSEEMWKTMLIGFKILLEK